MLASQAAATEQGYSIDQSQLVPSQRQVSTVSSHYGSAYETSPDVLRYSSSQSSRKRSYPDEYGYEYSGMQHMAAHAAVDMNGSHSSLGYSYQVPSQRASPTHQTQQLYGLSSQQQHHHHHHRLPNQPPPSKYARMGEMEDDHGPPSVVGQPGMPEPALRPKGPKLKFTSEDDSLLVELKETKNLTWKQIADFFPGRSSGTLQVRYCTKLKAKTTVWTDEMVQKLRQATDEYENDRWRMISSKVGNGFSATACKEKSMELSGEEEDDDDDDDDDDDAHSMMADEDIEGSNAVIIASPLQIEHHSPKHEDHRDDGYRMGSHPVSMSTPTTSAATSVHYRDAEGYITPATNSAPVHVLEHQQRHMHHTANSFDHVGASPYFTAAPNRFDVLVTS